MPDYDSYAAAITIRENVLRTALQTAYVGGSSSSRQFTEDLSHSGATIKPAPALFLGEPDINCNGALIVPGEGTPGAVIVTQPVRGPVSVTADGQTTTVGIAGQAQIAIAPQLGHGSDKSNIAFTAFSAVSVPSWTATVTTPGTSATIADLLIGDAFRQQLETVIRVGVLEHKITLPDIPAGFLIDLPAAAASFEPRVRDGVLLIGVGYGDDTRRLYGTRRTCRTSPAATTSPPPSTRPPPTSCSPACATNSPRTLKTTARRSSPSRSPRRTGSSAAAERSATPQAR